MHYKKLNNLPASIDTIIVAYNAGVKPALMQKIQWVAVLVSQSIGDSFNEKLYNLIHNHPNHNCLNCSTPTKFYHKEFNRGYAQFCSYSCRAIFNKSHLNGYSSSDIIKKRACSIKNSHNKRSSQEKKDTVQKANNTKKQKYGKDYSKIIARNALITKLGEATYNKLYSNSDFLYNEYIIKQRSIVAIGKDLQISDGPVRRALKYNNIPLRKRTFTSNLEYVIEQWLICNNIAFIRSNKDVIKPYELDFYCYGHNIAIEICGLYYHSADNEHLSSNRKDKKYHQNKFIQCKEKDIKLITIFEDEILAKLELVKMRLNHIFKLNKSVALYARKCTVQDVSRQEAREFFKSYHLQGSITGSVNKGLYYNGELVSCISLAAPRYTKKYDYELLRYCTKNCSVVGGLSKLINSISGSIITYSCNRWGDGEGYAKTNFKRVSMTKPNYFYFKPSNPSVKYHRSQFMKHKLNTNLTEVEEMKKRGYMRIFDCGTTVWVLRETKIKP